jgi:ubiquinone/menaquinone biosynthesis C-methylase UbiE
MKKETAKNLVQQVQEDYDLIAEEFSQSRFKTWYEFHIYKELIEEGDIVLDLGCGNGRLLKSLHDRKVDYRGVDLSKGLIKQAQENFSYRRFINDNGQKEVVDKDTEYVFKKGSFNEIPYTDESIDNVISVAAFHHIPGEKMRKDALDEVARVLKDGGYFAFSVWNLFQPRWRKLILESLMPSRLKKYKFRDCFVSWGKSDVKRYYHAFTPWEVRKLIKESNMVLIEELYVTKKGMVRNWWRSENMVFICKKGLADE